MQSQADCIFCQIVAGQSPCFRVHEDAEALALHSRVRGDDAELAEIAGQLARALL